MPAAALLFDHGLRHGFHPGERIVYAALWLIPTLGMSLNREGLPVMALVICLFAGFAWLRLRSAAKVELPGTARAR
jgi:hypothetical protein